MTITPPATPPSPRLATMFGSLFTAIPSLAIAGTAFLYFAGYVFLDTYRRSLGLAFGSGGVCGRGRNPKPACASSPDCCQHRVMRIIAFGSLDKDLRMVSLTREPCYGEQLLCAEIYLGG